MIAVAICFVLLALIFVASIATLALQSEIVSLQGPQRGSVGHRGDPGVRGSDFFALGITGPDGMTGPTGGTGDTGPQYVPVGNTIFVDTTFGDDTTAQPYRQNLPFFTLTGALAAATGGDVIVIRPGTLSLDTGIVISKPVTLRGDSYQTFPGVASTTLTKTNSSGNAIVLNTGAALSNLQVVCTTSNPSDSITAIRATDITAAMQDVVVNILSSSSTATGTFIGVQYDTSGISTTGFINLNNCSVLVSNAGNVTNATYRALDCRAATLSDPVQALNSEFLSFSAVSVVNTGIHQGALISTGAGIWAQNCIFQGDTGSTGGGFDLFANTSSADQVRFSTPCRLRTGNSFSRSFSTPVGCQINTIGLAGQIQIGTQFLPPWGFYLTAPTIPLASNGALTIGKTTIFKNLYVRLNTATSAISSISVTLLRNGVATSLIVTIPASTLLASNTIDAVTCYQNDVITMRIIGSGSQIDLGSNLNATIESY